MKKPVRQWLEEIADPKIRKAAISQINKNCSNWPEDGIADSLDDALDAFNVWCETEEGDNYWYKIWLSAIDGKLETREVEATKFKEGYIPYSNEQERLWAIAQAERMGAKEWGGNQAYKDKRDKYIAVCNSQQSGGLIWLDENDYDPGRGTLIPLERPEEATKPTDHVKDDQHRVTIKYSFDKLGREICDIEAKGTKDDILNSLGMFWGLEIKENVNPYILTQSINEQSAKAFSNFKISSEPMTDEEAREATKLEKPFSSWYGEEKLGFSYDMDKLTPEYKEDGTIILKPKKKEKVWIEVYFSAIDDSICTTEHLSKEELKESIEVGKEDGDTLLEVIEREYKI